MRDRAAPFAKLPKPASENEDIDAVMLNEWGNLDNDIRIKLINRRLKKDCKTKVVIVSLLESISVSWFVWCFMKSPRCSSQCIPRQRKVSDES